MSEASTLLCTNNPGGPESNSSKKSRLVTYLCLRVLTSGEVIDDNIHLCRNSELLTEEFPTGNLIGVSVDVQEQQKMRRS